MDADRLRGILNFPKPKTKSQLGGFLGPAGYCRNLDSKFLLWLSPYNTLLKTCKPDPINWGDQDDPAFEALKKSLDILIISFPFSSLYVRRKGMPLEYSSKTMGTITDHGVLEPAAGLWHGLVPLHESHSCHCPSG